MTSILIVEGNTPASVAAGQSGAQGFIRTLAALAPHAECRVVNPYAGTLSETVFDGVNGVIFTGSGEPWSTAAPEAAPQRAAMEAAFASGLPVWGSCNGLQLATVVLGGQIGASPNGIEVGVARDIALTDAGRAHAIMARRSDGFAVPCIHRDEVTVAPDGAVIVAGNVHSPVQVMVYAQGGTDFWGSQYHPELTTRDIAGFVRASGIFETFADMADTLEAADTDDEQAARLGTTALDLAVDHRARELANWVSHVQARRDMAD